MLANPLTPVVHSTPVQLNVPPMMSFDPLCSASGHTKEKATYVKDIATLITFNDTETEFAYRNTSQRRVDFARLNSELDEIVKGNLSLDSVNEYNSTELLFLCKEAARRAIAAHAIIEELAKEFDVDLTKHHH